MIHILPDDLTEMRWHSIMLVVICCRVCREQSLRVLAVHVAKVGLNITCQTLQENVQTNDVVTTDTTPNVYVKEMLVVAFGSSMWIITIP